MKKANRSHLRFLLSTALILGGCVLPALAYYHPDDGRWLSRDPIEEEGGVLLRYQAENPFCKKQFDGSIIQRVLWTLTRAA